MKPRIDLQEFDWSNVQLYYDTGATWRDVLKKFSMASCHLHWGVKNKKVILRTRSVASKKAHNTGKYDYSIYRTEKHRKIMAGLGGYRENSGRCKHIKYTRKDGIIVDLQGTWEEKIVKFFDEQNIEWKRNRTGQKYFFGGKDRMYFPDFFLPKFQMYVEVKGYETDKDRAKWSQFPFKLSVVKKKEINDLKLWWGNCVFKAVNKRTV